MGAPPRISELQRESRLRVLCRTCATRPMDPQKTSSPEDLLEGTLILSHLCKDQLFPDVFVLGLRKHERYSSLLEANPNGGLLNRAGKLREYHCPPHHPGASQAGPEGARCLRWHLFSTLHLHLRFPLQKDAPAAGGAAGSQKLV